MTTATGHTIAILASKVKGTTVFDRSGHKIGHIEDVVLDKLTDHIMFAALGIGGMLGVGEKFLPIPWSMLDYNEDKGGYVVPLEYDTISKAPTYHIRELTKNDGEWGIMRGAAYDVFNVKRDW